ncbi:hypothetical protein L345_18517, partial [Ophiophagus hannah]
MLVTWQEKRLKIDNMDKAQDLEPRRPMTGTRRNGTRRKK